MAIAIECRCGTRFQVEDKRQGSRVECPTCGRLLTAPDALRSDFDVFISYSKRDRPVADQVCAALEADNIRCWIAPRNIVAGMRWGEAIIAGMERCRAMLLVFSSHASESDQVWREVERAASKGLPIIPFRIDNVEPSKRLELYIAGAHWQDAFEPPLSKHLRRLPRSVRAVLSLKPAASTTSGAAAMHPSSDQPLHSTATSAQAGAAPGSKAVIIAICAAAALLVCLVPLILLISNGTPAAVTPEPEAAARGSEGAPPVSEARDRPQPAQENARRTRDTAAASRSQHYARGLHYLSRRDYDQAIRYLSADIQDNPRHMEAYANRGLAYSRKGDYKSAIADFTEMARLDPTNASAYSFRGQACMHTKDYAQAVADFTEVLRHKPDSTAAFAFRGQANAGLGKHQQAVSDFTEVIRRNPRSAETYYRRSLSYAHIGQAGLAKADRDRARSLDPNIEKKLTKE